MLSEIYLKAIKKVITVVEDIIGEPKTTGWLKKSLWCDLEERCLRYSKIFFENILGQAPGCQN